jgi:hypothetical protein
MSPDELDAFRAHVRGSGKEKKKRGLLSSRG